MRSNDVEVEEVPEATSLLMESTTRLGCVTAGTPYQELLTPPYDCLLTGARLAGGCSQSGGRCDVDPTVQTSSQGSSRVSRLASMMTAALSGSTPSSPWPIRAGVDVQVGLATGVAPRVNGLTDQPCRSTMGYV